jgi:nucleotide-binding universal stress UspA family protein
MYSKILVPLDGSKRAEAILPHVEELALCCRARVILVTVPDPMLRVPEMIEVEWTDYRLYQKEFAERIEEVQSYLNGLQGGFREKGIDTRVSLEHGPVVEGILNTAEREEADLIAIASHGRTGLSRVFYGSVAAGLLHQVDRPLLLIRSED